jgi:hypothetical protein
MPAPRVSVVIDVAAALAHCRARFMAITLALPRPVVKCRGQDRPGLLRLVIQRQAGAPNGQSMRRSAARSYRSGYQMANQAGLVRNCITPGHNAPAPTAG